MTSELCLPSPSSQLANTQDELDTHVSHLASKNSPDIDQDEQVSAPRAKRIKSLLLTPFRCSRRPKTTPTLQESFNRRGPLLGLGAILFVLLSIPAEAVLLNISNGQAVANWTPEVNIYLVVLTGIGNKAIAFAALQGALVTWWLKALRGTTIRQLHVNWDLGASLWAAITAGRSFNLLALTTLLAAMAFVDGPLLQSTSHVVQRSLLEPVFLQANISAEILTNYTGIPTVPGYSPALLTTEGGISTHFQPIFNDDELDLPIHWPVHGCPGECNTTVQAAALVSNGCDMLLNGYVNVTELWSGGPTPKICNQTSAQANNLYACIFFLMGMSTVPSAGDYENVQLDIGWSDDSIANTGAGNYTQWRCSLRSAIAEYPVTISRNGTVVPDIATRRFSSFANNTGYNSIPVNTAINTTLGGIAFSTMLRFGTVFGLGHYYDEVLSWTAPSPRIMPLIENPAAWLVATTRYGGPLWPPKWHDPMEAVLAYANRLMFRTSIQAAQTVDHRELLDRLDDGLSVNIQMHGIRIDAQPVYKTRWGYFYGAAAIQLVCSLLVARTFWDYWKLGRPVSFSPLELAKAFDAPLLSNVNSNAEASEMALHADREIQYGAVRVDGIGGEDDGVARSLIFDDPEKTYEPMKTFQFI